MLLELGHRLIISRLHLIYQARETPTLTLKSPTEQNGSRRNWGAARVSLHLTGRLTICGWNCGCGGVDHVVALWMTGRCWKVLPPVSLLSPLGCHWWLVLWHMATVAINTACAENCSNIYYMATVPHELRSLNIPPPPPPHVLLGSTHQTTHTHSVTSRIHPSDHTHTQCHF